MTLDDIKDMFFIQCYLLNSSMEQIINEINTSKSFWYFLGRINKLLDSNNYLLFFEDGEINKIKAIIEQLTFVYYSANYIKRFQRVVYHKLCMMERNFAKFNSTIIGNTLEEEKKLRCLPQEVDFTIECLNDFNKRDFDNYKLLLYPENNYSNIDFISFFSTVNKICNLNSFVFEDSNLKIGFNIALLNFKRMCDDDILFQYALDTLERVEKNKVYRFPNFSN